MNAPLGRGPVAPITEALDFLLDELEGLLDDRLPMPPPDPFPISTGVDVLDDAFGGGLRIGMVTLIDGDLPAQAELVLGLIARRIDHRVLLDTPSVVQATTRLLSAFAGVPAAFVRKGHIDAGQWEKLVEAMPKLGHRDLVLSAAGSLMEIETAAAEQRPLVVLVQDLCRFGPPAEVVMELGEMAARRGVAVVATGIGIGELPRWSTDRTDSVGMYASKLGSRVSLLRPDPDDLLTCAHLDVDCITGVVTWQSEGNRLF
ncbi:MAG: hypothetical protein ABI239_10050 [Aquihabitans sp.]